MYDVTTGSYISAKLYVTEETTEESTDNKKYYLSCIPIFMFSNKGAAYLNMPHVGRCKEFKKMFEQTKKKNIMIPIDSIINIRPVISSTDKTDLTSYISPNTNQSTVSNSSDYSIRSHSPSSKSQSTSNIELEEVCDFNFDLVITTRHGKLIIKNSKNFEHWIQGIRSLQTELSFKSE
jgi:hypothetical protein